MVMSYYTVSKGQERQRTCAPCNTTTVQYSNDTNTDGRSVRGRPKSPGAHAYQHWPRSWRPAFTRSVTGLGDLLISQASSVVLPPRYPRYPGRYLSLLKTPAPGFLCVCSCNVLNSRQRTSSAKHVSLTGLRSLSYGPVARWPGSSGSTFLFPPAPSSSSSFLLAICASSPMSRQDIPNTPKMSNIQNISSYQRRYKPD